METKSKKEAKIINKMFQKISSSPRQDQILIASLRTSNKQLANVISPMHYYCPDPNCRTKLFPRLIVVSKKRLWKGFICKRCGHNALMWELLEDCEVIGQDSNDHDNWTDKWQEIKNKNIEEVIKKNLKKLIRIDEPTIK